jgi:predicted O-methyltransferase YrrM
MAAALQELGRGKITSVDLIETANEFVPTPESQLERLGLNGFVDIIRTMTGYTWYLHDKIRENSKDDICREVFDLCIIDGPKNWTIDGAAFFFVDKLLKSGGWLIFDDYSWTYADADNRRDSTDGITHRLLSESERNTPQIHEVFELLVVQHRNYSNFSRINNEWALAQKVSCESKSYSIVRNYNETYKDVAGWAFRKLVKLMRGI